MPISFADYRQGITDIHFAKDRTLVLGFMVNGSDGEGNRSEVLYALHPDGRIKKTNALPKPNPNFNRPHFAWKDAGAVPDSAEFIGHYEADMFTDAGPT